MEGKKGEINLKVNIENINESLELVREYIETLERATELADKLASVEFEVSISKR